MGGPGPSRLRCLALLLPQGRNLPPLRARAKAERDCACRPGLDFALLDLGPLPPSQLATMGKAKKTRKFAAVKRMLNPADPRLFVLPPARPSCGARSPRADCLAVVPLVAAAVQESQRREGVQKEAGGEGGREACCVSGPLFCSSPPIELEGVCCSGLCPSPCGPCSGSAG